jgi:hypothetical protein
MKARATIPQQVQIINKALASYIEDDADNKCYNVGLCWHFKNAIEDITKIDCDYDSIKLYIPLFTRQNAITYANASDESYWWNKTNSYHRIYFCKWMLKTMKEQMINDFITNILYKKYHFVYVEKFYSTEFNKYIIVPHPLSEVKSDVIKSLIRFHNKYKRAFGDDCLVIMKESEYVLDKNRIPVINEDKIK